MGRGNAPRRACSFSECRAAMAMTWAALDRGLRQAEIHMRPCGFDAPPGAGEDTPAAG